MAKLHRFIVLQRKVSLNIQFPSLISKICSLNLILSSFSHFILGHESAFKILLEQGANINDTHGSWRNTVLNSAALSGYFLWILHFSSFLHFTHTLIFSWIVCNYVRTFISFCLGNINIIKILLENGADVNAKSNEGDTPLHIAAKKGFQ